MIMGYIPSPAASKNALILPKKDVKKWPKNVTLHWYCNKSCNDFGRDAYRRLFWSAVTRPYRIM